MKTAHLVSYFYVIRCSIVVGRGGYRGQSPNWWHDVSSSISYIASLLFKDFSYQLKYYYYCFVEGLILNSICLNFVPFLWTRHAVTLCSFSHSSFGTLLLLMVIILFVLVF